jgi:hypothetical protein
MEAKMPHVTLMHFPGDPDDLLERKQRFLDPVTARVAPAAGGLAHIAAKTADGLLVINVMADRDGTETVGTHPDVEAALRASGLPQPRREHYRVERLVVTPAAVAAGNA